MSGKIPTGYIFQKQGTWRPPPAKCPHCQQPTDGEYTCVCQMGPGELMDEIATFEPSVEHHAAWKELTRRICAMFPAAYGKKTK